MAQPLPYPPPPDSALPPLSELLALSEVTDASLKRASNLWDRSPPDSQFKGLLSASEQGEGSG